LCADLMRSENPGEDIDGNGTTGEGHQANISVSYQGRLFNFGPFNNPTSQSTCQNGGCFDIGQLRLTQDKQLTVGLCTVNGIARSSEGGAPVANAMVFAYDELLEPDIFYQWFTNPAVTFFATTDANGAFSLTAPTLSGLTVFVSYSQSLGANTHEAGHGMVQTSGCPQSSLNVEVDRYRTTAVLNNTGEHVGSFYQQGSEVSGFVYLTIGSKVYWAVPPDDQPFRLPSQPGAAVTWSLHSIGGSGTDTVVGTITFTATTAIGGTWQSTGVALSGTWGN